MCRNSICPLFICVLQILWKWSKSLIFVFFICDNHYFFVFYFCDKKNDFENSEKQIITKNHILLNHENWWWLLFDMIIADHARPFSVTNICGYGNDRVFTIDSEYFLTNYIPMNLWKINHLRKLENLMIPQYFALRLCRSVCSTKFTKYLTSEVELLTQQF